jgi:hypothetical protein
MLTFMGSIERNIWGFLKRNKNLLFYNWCLGEKH